MLTNYISQETLDSFLNLCEERGASPDTMLRVMTAGYTRRARVYGLQDTLQFGKYYGLTLSDVVEADPAYAKWMWKKAEGVGIDDIAVGYLKERLNSLK